MEYIIKQETIHMGGGCYCDVITLFDNQVIVISDEVIGLYKSIDEFLNDDGTKCLSFFYLNSKKEA